MKTSHVKQDYPGGKGASGAAQQLINLMPPHKHYIELFAGGGFIFRLKRPAEINTAVDIDIDAIHTLQQRIEKEMKVQKIENREGENDIIFRQGLTFFILINENAFHYLDTLHNENMDRRNILLYADPPYIPAALSSHQRYKYKFGVEAHEALLSRLLKLKCMVMISGYDSALYNRMLPGWKTHTFTVRTRAAKGITTREETVWMNYDINQFNTRHDYRFLGDTFRDRERIRKQQRRWAAKLHRMPPLLRNAMLDKLTSTIK